MIPLPIPVPFTSDEMLQFFLAYMGDSQFYNDIRSISIWSRRRRRTTTTATVTTPLNTIGERRGYRRCMATNKRIILLVSLCILYIMMKASFQKTVEPTINLKHIRRGKYTRDQRGTHDGNSDIGSARAGSGLGIDTNNDALSTGRTTKTEIDGTEEPKTIFIEEREIQKDEKRRRLNMKKGLDSNENKDKNGHLSTNITTNAHDANEIVIAIGVSNDIITYKRFVGSLRHSGYQGTIILGRPKNQNQHKLQHQSKEAMIRNYLHSKNVIIQEIEVTDECYNQVVPEKKYIEVKEQVRQHQQTLKLDTRRNSCIKPYNDLKMGWTGHALARDWLKQHQSQMPQCDPNNKCNNQNPIVLLTPLSNLYFQQNPFTSYPRNKTISLSKRTTPSSPFLHFHEDAKTINDSVALLQCKKFLWDVPYIKSIVVADIESMKFYLEHMVAESYTWMSRSECYLSNTGMAIQNYLFYNGLVRPTFVFEHRKGIVNSVSMIAKYYKEHILGPYDDDAEIDARDLKWEDISLQLHEKQLIDNDGYFLNADGTRSTIVHQFDDFGRPFHKWLSKQAFMVEDSDDHNHDHDSDTEMKIDWKNENPVNNPLLYLSLESTFSHSGEDKVFLRKRKVVGKMVMSRN